MPIYLSFILFLTFSVSAQESSKKHIAIMGGGGEPQGETTIFDLSMKELGSYLKNKDPSWKPTVHFNGGHAETEKILKDSFGEKTDTTKPFTSQNYSETIKSYMKKIEEGDIKSGDQLLVWLNTHGAQAYSGEKGHMISATGKSSSDFTNLSQNTLVSTNELQSLIDLASEKGVKLGIIDFSCHSGASIALSNPKTCIISSTGPNHFAYSSFPSEIIDNMKKGKSLEDVFLDSFDSRYDIAFPMISTAHGKKVQDKLYDLAGPFLLNFDSNSGLDKLTPYLEKNSSPEMCLMEENNFKELLKLTLDAEKITMKVRQSDDYKNLRLALGKYKNVVEEYQESLSSLVKDNIAKKSTTICGTEKNEVQPVPLNCKRFTFKELSITDFDSEIIRLQNLYEKSSGDDKNYVEGSLKLMKKAKEKYEEISAQYPSLKKYSEFMNKNKNFAGRTRGLAQKVAEELKPLYLDMYKDMASKDTSPNPCKDFKL